MKFFAGIDGGQSSTTAVIGDETGTILGHGTAGPADEVGQDTTSTRLRDALETALARALENAKLERDTSFESIVAGISGFESKARGQAPRLNAKHVRLLHDAPIAHAGAFNGNPGVLVIAGTGSIAYGVGTNGKQARAGGWGYLFGDEGSAFWIGRAAIQQALNLEEMGKTDDPLMKANQNFFETESARMITRKYYNKEIGRDAIAAFAEVILQCAADGSEHCIKIAKSAAQELTQLASACAKNAALESGEVAFVGGLLKSGWFSEQIDAQLKRATLHRARVKHEPAVGALLLARQYVG